MTKIFLFNRVHFLKDFSILFIIFISPFLFFLYSLSPKNSVEWETWFFHINIENTGYEIDMVLWCISTYFLIILTLSLWFITCKHWWRYLILVPMLFEFDKIIFIYFELRYSIVDYKFFYSVIIPIPIIVILFIISKKLNYYSLSKSVNQQIDDEINVLMKQVSNYRNGDYKAFKNKLTILRKQKLQLEKKEFLIQLIKLREDFAINTQNK